MKASIIADRISSNPISDLSVRPNVSVNGPNSDDLGSDGGVLRYPDGEVSRWGNELRGVVVKVLQNRKLEKNVILALNDFLKKL